MEALQWLMLLSWALIIAGFITIFASLLLMALKAFRGRGGMRGGGVFLIGPFPIVFGTDVKAVKAAILLTIILMAAALSLMLFSLILLPRLAGLG